MADVFMDRVAELSGLTARRLREHQRVLHALGFLDEAESLNELIRQHEEVALTCYDYTDPGIDTGYAYRRPKS